MAASGRKGTLSINKLSFSSNDFLAALASSTGPSKSLRLYCSLTLGQSKKCLCSSPIVAKFSSPR